MLLEAPVRPERRKNTRSRVFSPPYDAFDRRALRMLTPSVRVQVRRATVWRWIAGEVSPIKRIIDLVGATVASILLAPLILVVALLIKLQDGGPIFFWQTRVGRKGRCFSFPKFRSMITNAEAVLESIQMMNHHRNGSITFKMKRDPRITPIGRFIRKYSIDELPQLWCIFRGDMSLVGPRPPLPREVDQYNPHDLRRLEVAPGLTCLWQVEGRGDLPFEKQVELDIKYVDNQSLWLDFKLLLRTLPAVLAGKGAY
jgi:lipopolysaccharide/colanic/teichoic acid biosynthesis glycosyltransferase